MTLGRIVSTFVAAAVLTACGGIHADETRPASGPIRSPPADADERIHHAPPAHLRPETAVPLRSGPIHPRPAVVTGHPLPPPGSLGRTYQLRSWSIPADRHPRVAMLDLRIPGATEVRVLNNNEYRNEDEVRGFQDLDDSSIWHFETKELIPGVPHIYRVEATIDDAQHVRYVRLIRGRRLEYDFSAAAATP